MTSEQILLLLFFLSLKHYLIDFLLQPEWMVAQKAKKLTVLILHAAMHGAGTFIVLLSFASLELAAGISLGEIIIHTAIDYVKSNPKLLGKYKPPTRLFFNLLGLDQLLHYLTYLGIAWLFV